MLTDINITPLCADMKFFVLVLLGMLMIAATDANGIPESSGGGYCSKQYHMLVIRALQTELEMGQWFMDHGSPFFDGSRG